MLVGSIVRFRKRFDCGKIKVAVRSVQVPVQVQEAPVQNVAEMNQVAEATKVDTTPVAPVATEEVLTDPVVPGMAKANLVVNVETVPGKAQTPHADAKMQQSDQQVLENLCGDGWSCSPIDAEKGLFEITLPAVRYELPMGVVSIPAPLFHAQVRSLANLSRLTELRALQHVPRRSVATDCLLVFQGPQLTSGV